MTHALASRPHSPIDQNTGSLSALAAVLESVLDVIRGEAVIPHHVRLEFVLKQRICRAWVAIVQLVWWRAERDVMPVLMGF